MAPTRIVADSDDSDEDFDVGGSPAKPPTPNLASEGRSSDPASVASGSTDPKYFQAIYDEQQGAVTNEPSSHPDRSSDPDGVDSSSLSAQVKAQTKKDDTNSSSLTSTTDPAMGSNRAKKTKKAKKPEVVDLTQVTTPGRSADYMPDDMWDVPSSPVGGQTAPVASLAKNKTPISTLKRKHGNNVEFTSPLAVEMPSQGSTQPFDITPGRANFGSVQAAKRQRTDIPGSSVPVEDDVDMVAVPGSSEMVPADDMTLAQTSASLCIEPRTLSASQRLQYEYHSVDPSPDDQRPAPSRHLTTQQAAARSSGATTIAYSTPSQTRLMGLPHEPFSDETEAISRRSPEAPEPEVIELQSSPDIISAAPARRNRNKSGNESPRSLESHPPDDVWNSDEIGFHREIYKPRPSRRRGSDTSRQSDTRDANTTEIPVADMGPTELPIEADVASASPPKAKKRGRPRKSETASASPVAAETTAPPRSAVMSESAEGSAAADAATAPTPKTKKKRGRPKKADKAAAESAQQEPEEQRAAAEPANNAKETTPSVNSNHATDRQSDQVEKPHKAKKSDRKRKCAEEVDENWPAGEDPSDTEEVRALQPTTPNTGLRPGSDDPDPQSAATEPKLAAAIVTPCQKGKEKKEVAGKADGKQGSTTPASSQTGKPLFRVGLSRKSRIAPLLKSLRK